MWIFNNLILNCLNMKKHRFNIKFGQFVFSSFRFKYKHHLTQHKIICLLWKIRLCYTIVVFYGYIYGCLMFKTRCWIHLQSVCFLFQCREHTTLVRWSCNGSKKRQTTTAKHNMDISVKYNINLLVHKSFNRFMFYKKYCKLKSFSRYM